MEQQSDIKSAKYYTLVLTGLIVLTLISAGLSQLNLGFVNTILAIGVAGLSACIVLGSFMKVKLDGAFARLLIAGILALALLIFFVAFVG